jgi:1-deoxy-D-xylulose-5-phosphate synthase
MEFGAGFSHPIAIRYPRGSAWTGLEGYEMPIEYGKAEWILRESELCILAIGSMVRTAMEVHDQLHAVARACSVVNLRFAAPIDYETVEKAAQTHRLLVVMEENVASGGVGEHIAAWMKEQNIDTRLIQIALPNAYIEHGSVDCLKKMIGIDSQSVFETIYTALNTEEAHETAD